MNHMLFFLHSIIFYLVPQLVFQAKTTGGFTVETIHRDSTLAPFYNPSSIHRDPSRAVRSILQANDYSTPSYSINIQSPVTPSRDDAGEYLMKLSIGNPPVEIQAIVDTGSDLVWVQCQNNQVFNPLGSSSFFTLACNSNQCQSLRQNPCDNNMECPYSSNYEDGSYSSGLMAFDTFTFDSPTTNTEAYSFPNLVFGCAQLNQGFGDGTSGLVGLGRGPLSLVSQLGDAIQQKFSYCLTPPDTSSAGKLRFGPDADLSTTGDALTTPLLSRSSDNFYYLNLEGISVGDNMIVNKDVDSNEGNIVIDSGTTLTKLESSFYSELEAAVKKVIGMEPVQEPNNGSLCYETSSFSRVPRNTTMVFHFTGANVMLSEVNIFRKFGDQTCLAITTKDKNSIYGNLAQVNFHIVYDLGRELLSFAPADCIVL